MSAAAARKPPPDLLDHLTAADRAADAWLKSATGKNWRWPKVQGRDDDADDADQPQPQQRERAEHVRLDAPELLLEVEQTLHALAAGGQIDDAGYRTELGRRPATCGEEDLEALPVVDAARQSHRCPRSIQTKRARDARLRPVPVS